jgi:hypothetical protein
MLTFSPETNAAVTTVQDEIVPIVRRVRYDKEQSFQSYISGPRCTDDSVGDSIL